MADFHICFTATLQRFDSLLWDCHIVVPDEVAKKILSVGSKRVVCTLFGKDEFQCGLMSRGKVLKSAGAGKYFININKKMRDRHCLEIGSKVEACLYPDHSRYGLPMPEEMAELLAQDPEGDQYFHALTPGKQRSLLFIAGKPKGVETRLKKAIVIIEHLKANMGKLDFKELNQDFKTANRSPHL